MEFPAELRNEINNLLENENITELAKTVSRLSENYRSEQKSGKISAKSRADILAYAAVRMPATFGAVSRALELSLECCGCEIGSVLDVGAGTGAGAIAASIITECDNIICLEKEPEMSELGKHFANVMGISAEYILRDINDGISEKADLVICSYCLNELPENRRKSVVENLMRAAKKLLVIVEPGTPYSFNEMKAIRSQLVSRGMKIAAPCPQSGECPIVGDDWCHFSVRVPRSRLHKQLKGGEVPYEDEKFCFIAAAHGDTFPCSRRILRKPFIESGRVTLTLCSEAGISTELITRKNDLFKTARKADTGDKI